MISVPIRRGLELRVTPNLLSYALSMATHMECLVKWIPSDQLFSLKWTSWESHATVGKQRMLVVAEGAPYPLYEWSDVFGVE